MVESSVSRGWIVTKAVDQLTHLNNGEMLPLRYEIWRGSSPTRSLFSLMAVMTSFSYLDPMRTKAHRPAYLQRPALLAVIFITMAIVLPIGCAHQPALDSKPKIKPSTTQTPENYHAFLVENRVLIERVYSQDYTECQFEVDSEEGTILVQKLIEPDKVSEIINKTIPLGTEDQRIIDLVHEYITTTIQFQPMPNVWPTISETLARKEADCKGLSLLMLSLLLAANQNAYAAINNGHMWVVVWVDGRWKQVETDPNPQRVNLYASVPDFYIQPIFKIYADRTLKRRRREHLALPTVQ